MGHYANYMCGKGFDVTGVDISKEMLKIAKTHYNNNKKVKFLAMNVLDLTDKSFCHIGGVLISYLLQHFTKTETDILLKHIIKYLNPLGKLLMFVREGTETAVIEKELFNQNYQYLINAYTKDELIKILSEVGFINICITDKPLIDDEYSLAPKTLVVTATKK